ncbi:Ig-like domain-containing protein [Brevibacillus reuszeri]|uniref:Ig-like domain-containing protein n=1 Tax=Brevibacillus reuszeri TaxID=54915 RepID=UPI002898D15A|nr:Ig-like domain-containing protein [Brevibacillus reuszeri]
MKKWMGIRWLHFLSVMGLLLLLTQSAWAKVESDWGVRITPTSKADQIDPEAVITLSFSQQIKLASNKDITEKALAAAIQLTDTKKKKVAFTAKWNKTNRSVTVDPVGNLEAGQSYKVTLLEKKLKDAKGQLNPEVSSTFSTKKQVDQIPPKAVILPGDGAKQVKLQEKITLQFAEDVFLKDGTILSSKTAVGLVQVKDGKGSVIPHTVTWNKSKRTITVKPKGASWLPHTSYQISLSGGQLKDAEGNLNPSQTSRFSTGATK